MIYHLRTPCSILDQHPQVMTPSFSVQMHDALSARSPDSEDAGTAGAAMARVARKRTTMEEKSFMI